MSTPFQDVWARRGPRWVLAAAAALLLAALVLTTRQNEPSTATGLTLAHRGRVLADACSTWLGRNGTAAADREAGVGADACHPLFHQIDADLAPFRDKAGISLRMVEQAYCSSRTMGFRLQVIDGRAYVVGQAGEWQSRLLSIQRQLLAAAHSPAWRLPDLDVVVEQSDFPTETATSEACPERGPIIAPTKRRGLPGHTHVLLAPDFAWAEWVEVRMLSWEEQMQIADTAQLDYPWQERHPTMLFRGAPTGAIRPKLGFGIWEWAHENGWLDPVAESAPDRGPPVFDTLIEGNVHDQQASLFLTLMDHCAYKYLLHIPGNSWSVRLRYLLACGSVVVRLQLPREPWVEFYYHLLQNGTNNIELPVWDPLAEGTAGALASLVSSLRAADSEAAAMGTAARALVADVLSSDRVLQYWARLLTAYAQLQTFKPTLHPDAVPIEQAVLTRHDIDWSQRRCEVCPF